MSKVASIEQERGNLNEIIPKLVNEKGQAETARELGLSPATINVWLKTNGYVKRIQYVKEGAK